MEYDQDDEKFTPMPQGTADIVVLFAFVIGCIISLIV